MKIVIKDRKRSNSGCEGIREDFPQLILNPREEHRSRGDRVVEEKERWKKENEGRRKGGKWNEIENKRKNSGLGPRVMDRPM